MSKLVAILNPWMSVIFAIFVALQWTDPDPYLSLPTYGSAMVACILRQLGMLRPWMSGAVLLVALGWAAWILLEENPDPHLADMFQSMKASNPSIEESREMYGLLIVAAWMAALTLA